MLELRHLITTWLVTNTAQQIQHICSRTDAELFELYNEERDSKTLDDAALLNDIYNR